MRLSVRFRFEMVWRNAAVCAALAVCGAAGRTAAAQETNVSDSLRSLASRAGLAFAGEVTEIRRVNSIVEVEFRVEQPVFGVSAGSYTLREWSGLWAAGQRRYWVGERAMVFLHAPSQGGVATPVDGMDGVLLLKGTATAGEQASVERLRTRVLRAVGDPLPAGPATISIDEVRATVLASDTAGPPQAVKRNAPVGGGVSAPEDGARRMPAARRKKIEDLRDGY